MIAVVIALLLLALGTWALGLLTAPLFLLLLYALIGSFFFSRTLAEKRALKASGRRIAAPFTPLFGALAAGLAWPLVLLAVSLYCLGQAWLVRRFERSRRQTAAGPAGQAKTRPDRRSLLLDDRT